jgi:hypothetical protein
MIVFKLIKIINLINSNFLVLINLVPAIAVKVLK